MGRLTLKQYGDKVIGRTQRDLLRHPIRDLGTKFDGDRSAGRGWRDLPRFTKVNEA